MRILDTYFRPDAPGAVTVPISDRCRTTTLQFKASSIYIFDRARAEILEKMGIGKVLPASGDPPPEQAPIIGRGYSSATTGVGSSYPNSPGQIETAAIESFPNSRSTLTAADTLDLSQPQVVPPPIKASPSFSHSPSTAESLQYSEDSSSPRSPLTLSPLHPVSSSPRDPEDANSDNGKHRRSAEVRTTDNSPDTPMTLPLDYRRTARDSKNKRDERQVDGDGSSGDAGSSVDSAEHRSRGRNAILSLFGRLGGGEKRRGSRRVQEGGSSAEPSPRVVHMTDEGFDSDGSANNEAAAAEQGVAGAATTLGRTGDRGSGVRQVAGVADVHAAFGLQRSKDEEDDGTLGKKQKKHDKEVAVLSSGIGGYGGILGGVRSDPDDSTDLAEAARAIPHPLFGDPSRAVGRQNDRRGNRAYHTTPRTSAVTVTVAAADADDKAFATVTSHTPMAVVPGNSLDLANAYGLDIGALDEQESPLPVTTTTTTTTTSGGGGGAAATTQVNPLFDGGSAGGGKVRALARVFDAEAQAVAVSGGLSVDNNKIGPARRKALAGKRKGQRGGGGGG
ncbi:unnamed protein product, partial [Hapterophycus canaliculatus]